MSVVQIIASQLANIPNVKRYIVGLSGGLDSVCLLDAMSQLELGAPLLAIHVNHGLSSSATEWEQFCSGMCHEKKVAFVKDSVASDVAVNIEKGMGVEAAARKARYSTFAKFMKDGDVLLTAHHMDDQAETFLFRAFRGQTVKSLQSIPRSRNLEAGRVFRPLLSVTRRQLSDYAHTRSLKWVEDESNSDVRFDRNFIRSELMPVILKRWPNAAEGLSAVTEELKEVDRFVQEWCAEQYLSFTSAVRYEKVRALSLESLSALSRTRQKFLVKYWLHACRVVSTKNVLKRVFNELIPENLADIEENKQVKLVVHGGVLWLYRRHVYFVKEHWLEDRIFNVALNKEQIESGFDLTFPFGRVNVSCTNLSESVDQLNSQSAAVLHIDQKIFEKGMTLSFRNRVEGEKLAQRPGKLVSLKKIYKDQHLPPWYRQSLPIIYLNEQVIATLTGVVSHEFSGCASSHNMNHVRISIGQFQD